MSIFVPPSKKSVIGLPYLEMKKNEFLSLLFSIKDVVMPEKVRIREIIKCNWISLSPMALEMYLCSTLPKELKDGYLLSKPQKDTRIEINESHGKSPLKELIENLSVNLPLSGLVEDIIETPFQDLSSFTHNLEETTRFYNIPYVSKYTNKLDIKIRRSQENPPKKDSNKKPVSPDKIITVDDIEQEDIEMADSMKLPKDLVPSRSSSKLATFLDYEKVLTFVNNTFYILDVIHLGCIVKKKYYRWIFNDSLENINEIKIKYPWLGTNWMDHETCYYVCKIVSVKNNCSHDIAFNDSIMMKHKPKGCANMFGVISYKKTGGYNRSIFNNRLPNKYESWYDYFYEAEYSKIMTDNKIHKGTELVSVDESVLGTSVTFKSVDCDSFEEAEKKTNSAISLIQKKYYQDKMIYDQSHSILNLLENKIKEIDSTTINKPPLQSLKNNDIAQIDEEQQYIDKCIKWADSTIDLPNGCIIYGNYAIKHTRKVISIYKLVFISTTIYSKQSDRLIFSKTILASDIPEWGDGFDKIKHCEKFSKIKERVDNINNRFANRIATETSGVNNMQYELCCVEAGTVMLCGYVGLHAEEIRTVFSVGRFIFGIENVTHVNQQDFAPLKIKRNLLTNNNRKKKIILLLMKLSRLYTDSLHINVDEINSHQSLESEYPHIIDCEKKAVEEIERIMNFTIQKKNDPPSLEKDNKEIIVDNVKQPDFKLEPQSDNNKKSEIITKVVDIIGKCVGAQCSRKIIKEDDLHVFIKCNSNCRMLLHYSCWRQIAKGFNYICLTPLCNEKIDILESRDGLEEHNLLKSDKNIKPTKKISKIIKKENKNIPLEPENSDSNHKIESGSINSNKDHKKCSPTKEKITQLIPTDKLVTLIPKKHATTTSIIKINTGTSNPRLSVPSCPRWGVQETSNKKALKSKPLHLNEFRMMTDNVPENVWKKSTEKSDMSKNNPTINILPRNPVDSNNDPNNKSCGDNKDTKHVRQSESTTPPVSADQVEGKTDSDKSNNQIEGVPSNPHKSLDNIPKLQINIPKENITTNIITTTTEKPIIPDKVQSSEPVKVITKSIISDKVQSPESVKVITKPIPLLKKLKKKPRNNFYKVPQRIRLINSQLHTSTIQTQNYQPLVQSQNYQPLVQSQNYQPLIQSQNYQPLVQSQNYQPLVQSQNYQPLVQQNYQVPIPYTNNQQQLQSTYLPFVQPQMYYQPQVLQQSPPPPSVYYQPQVLQQSPPPPSVYHDLIQERLQNLMDAGQISVPSDYQNPPPVYPAQVNQYTNQQFIQTNQYYL